MSLKESRDTTREILGRIGRDPVLVSISTGKESVSMLHACIEAGVPCRAIHRYLVPGLEFEEEILDALEARFAIKITRLEDPVVRIMRNSDTLMINRVWDIEDSKSPNWPRFDNFILTEHGCKWLALGCRITDGPARALALTKTPNPSPNTRKIYPLAHWKKQDVWDYMTRHRLPKSRTYEWFKRSMDCLNVKHVYPLKLFAPQDYEKILDAFPLLEPLIWLYEKRIAKYGSHAVPEC